MSPTPSIKTDLRNGWTTGTCATAAVKSAFYALVTNTFLDPVTVRLPKGQTPSFALAERSLGPGWASAGVVKDAGDDPDVTHGALICAKVRLAGSGITFLAGDGVGRVTKPGLPLAPGEPAINPVPRHMMRSAVEELARELGVPPHVTIEIAIPGGLELAAKTWNPRLGIVGGLSILGTTGIVRPYSCSAWIASIHRGIDVARAAGLDHLVGATGNTSELAVRRLRDLSDSAFLDMGDFVGGMLKYLRRHPVPRVTIAGGFAKMCKLAQGAKDLHSSRSQIDFAALATLAPHGGKQIAGAATGFQALDLGGSALAERVAAKARLEATRMAGNAAIEIDVVVVDRAGAIVGHATCT